MTAGAGTFTSWRTAGTVSTLPSSASISPPPAEAVDQASPWNSWSGRRRGAGRSGTRSKKWTERTRPRPSVHVPGSRSVYPVRSRLVIGVMHDIIANPRPAWMCQEHCPGVIGVEGERCHGRPGCGQGRDGWLSCLLGGAVTLYLHDSENPGSGSTRWERAPVPSGTPSHCPVPTAEARDNPRSCTYWERG